MRGISRKPFPYICEVDKGKPKEEQTVFYLLPIKQKEAVEILENYNKAMKRNSITGNDDIDGSRWMGAGKEEFLRVIHSVENYWFSEDAEVKNDEPVKIKEEDGELKEALFHDLTSDIISELVSKAKGLTASVADKKKLK